MAINVAIDGPAGAGKSTIAKAVASMVDDIKVSIKYEDGQQHVILNDEDVTGLIRTEAVGNMASATSVYGPVRTKLVALQQELAKTTDVIMDGRDIGTVVLPNADVKIFLTASVECRAKRRYDELELRVRKLTLLRLQKILRKEITEILIEKLAHLSRLRMQYLLIVLI